MKRIHLIPFAIFALMSCTGNQSKTGESSGDKVAIEEGYNQLTEDEESQGWRLLFDGQTTSGWHRYLDDTIGKKWQVVDGMLYFTGREENEEDSEGGDIVTDEEFENYEMTLEWKISPGGNSGIIYNVIESEEYPSSWNTGLEMQVLDNEAHPDAQITKHRAGDLYDLISCTEETVKPAGEWNQVRLVVNNGKVQHWLNGIKVVEIDLWTQEWDSLVAGSKFKDMAGYGTGKKGRIALQDHDDPVWYRNIKIREL